MTSLRVAEVGEESLLAQIVPLLPPGEATLLGPGDDAAILAAPDGRVVVSTDILVEEQHFRRDWGTGLDLGWRAAVQNLADIAAMGARATGIVVGLALPGDLEVAWVLDLARGLALACAPHGVGVVGGDLSRAERVMVAVTVHGDLGGRDPVLRSGARAGDIVAVAGTLGRARAGHALLTAHGMVDDPLVGSFLRPDPPIALGVVAADAGAHAMMDVSDGLLRDAARIARASGVRLDLDPEALAHFAAPLRPTAEQLGADPMDWVLTGGEDHALLATFPADAVLPDGFVGIGAVTTVTSPDVVVGGKPYAGSPGFDHFGDA